jgi:small-conductance mechanosensitive channel
MILDTMGISITPILTTLGIGSLAVALALQDTLSNFFAGIYMSVDRPIRVGDYIRIDSGDEGYVDNIGWRSTRIRSLSNNSIIIPNQRLSQSIITNYFLPEPRMSLLIQINVSYESDPEKVEHILLETVKRAKDIDGLILDAPYSPIVRFIPGFAESSLQFTLVCQVKQFIDQYPVQHELRKRILKRFQQERISIPFPTRTIYLDNRIKRK